MAPAQEDEMQIDEAVHIFKKKEELFTSLLSFKRAAFTFHHQLSLKTRVFRFSSFQSYL